jgi:hypothetical protein
MRILSVLSALVLLFFACNEAAENNVLSTSQSYVDSLNNSKHLPPDFRESGDTAFISGRMALFFLPDSAKAEKLKSGNKEEFFTTADDYLVYIAETREYIDSTGLFNKTTDKNIFVFIKNNGERKILKSNSTDNIWGSYFFDGVKDPISADIFDGGHEDYKNYFSKF